MILTLITLPFDLLKFTTNPLELGSKKMEKEVRVLIYGFKEKKLLSSSIYPSRSLRSMYDLRYILSIISGTSAGVSLEASKLSDTIISGIYYF